MKLRSLHLPTKLLSLISLLSTLPSISTQTCQKTCGNLPLKYPFGSGPGCGDPKFQHSITCYDSKNNQQQELTFKTHSGSYPITSIDYTNHLLYLQDPSMSTCACSQSSKGFSLDWDQPFTFHETTIFALLDCSINSSPIYDPNGVEVELLNWNTSSSTTSSTIKVSLCDNKSSPNICSFLYTCRPISTLNIPISACCVYTPLNYGPSFEMDLEKLKCGSYSGFYSFDGREDDPEKWKYGIVIEYKFAIDNEYPSWCESCERSMGVCGYATNDNYINGGYVNDGSFSCNCPNGFNTSTDCFFVTNYGSGSRIFPRNIWTGLMVIIFSLPWLLPEIL